MNDNITPQPLPAVQVQDDIIVIIDQVSLGEPEKTDLLNLYNQAKQ